MQTVIGKGMVPLPWAVTTAGGGALRWKCQAFCYATVSRISEAQNKTRGRGFMESSLSSSSPGASSSASSSSPVSSSSSSSSSSPTSPPSASSSSSSSSSGSIRSYYSGPDIPPSSASSSSSPPLTSSRQSRKANDIEIVGDLLNPVPSSSFYSAPVPSPKDDVRSNSSSISPPSSQSSSRSGGAGEASCPERYTIQQLLDFGKNMNTRRLLFSARYLHRELPLRLEFHIHSFQSLPYIVGCNPYIKTVHDLYMKAYRALKAFPSIETTRDEERFSVLLSFLVEKNQNIIPTLALGAYESQKYMSQSDLESFVNNTMRSRIGIRLLAGQHLAVRDPKPDCIGLIELNLSPHKAIKEVTSVVQKTFEDEFNFTPDVVIKGHLDATFAYIPSHLHYMLSEILSNSIRALLNTRRGEEKIPPIEVTIAKGSQDVTIRVMDCGGGFKTDMFDTAFGVHESCFTKMESNERIEMMESVQKDTWAAIDLGGRPTPSSELLSSWKLQAKAGFGLSIARVYAEYFGGALSCQSMDGYGTYSYIRLNHIGDKMENIRI
eukprot:Nk52_evm88s1073 gene=Nk52_evmTU88s1073